MPRVRGALESTFKVLPDVRSPVAVVLYMDTHTYKPNVLLYSEFMFNSGDCERRPLREGVPLGLQEIEVFIK